MLAQASAEFILVITLLLFIFLIFYVVYVDQASNLVRSRERLSATHEAYALSIAMNYVYLAGDGASLEYPLPFHDGRGNLTVSGAVVESAQGEAVSQSPLLANIQNATQVSSAQVTIRNNGGVLSVEP
ncbi:hypothetical protein L0Y65_03105 [Candidatus Micrarchaeota archaeon]|nr:hypothetical protein [Candidatus Micrarchaeota archaeon]